MATTMNVVTVTREGSVLHIFRSDKDAMTKVFQEPFMHFTPSVLKTLKTTYKKALKQETRGTTKHSRLAALYYLELILWKTGNDSSSPSFMVYKGNLKPGKVNKSKAVLSVKFPEIKNPTAQATSSRSMKKRPHMIIKLSQLARDEIHEKLSIPVRKFPLLFVYWNNKHPRTVLLICFPEQSFKEIMDYLKKSRDRLLVDLYKQIEEYLSNDENVEKIVARLIKSWKDKDELREYLIERGVRLGSNENNNTVLASLDELSSNFKIPEKSLYELSNFLVKSLISPKAEELCMSSGLLGLQVDKNNNLRCPYCRMTGKITTLVSGSTITYQCTYCNKNVLTIHMESKHLIFPEELQDVLDESLLPSAFKITYKGTSKNTRNKPRSLVSRRRVSPLTLVKLS